MDLVKSLKLNNNRNEALVDQMYGINRRLVSLEGKLLRLAEAHGVDRAEFLKQYFGNELDPNWARRVGRLSGIGWAGFRNRGTRPHQVVAGRHPGPGEGNPPVGQRIPPQRADRAERRARKRRRQEGN